MNTQNIQNQNSQVLGGKFRLVKSTFGGSGVTLGLFFLEISIAKCFAPVDMALVLT